MKGYLEAAVPGLLTLPLLDVLLAALVVAAGVVDLPVHHEVGLHQSLLLLPVGLSQAPEEIPP